MLHISYPCRFTSNKNANSVALLGILSESGTCNVLLVVLTAYNAHAQEIKEPIRGDLTDHICAGNVRQDTLVKKTISSSIFVIHVCICRRENVMVAEINEYSHYGLNEYYSMNIDSPYVLNEY